ncbi:hypothetical protein LZ32DRAFT_55529 [Colletotrichum eremochloae]|nr:hypothetical protein LZ32DRAFT_55529 [Colletotrichum eremochloae]
MWPLDSRVSIYLPLQARKTFKLPPRNHVTPASPAQTLPPPPSLSPPLILAGQLCMSA